MTKQEAYQELRTRLDAINTAADAARAFAKEHGLVMGTTRSDPFYLRVTKSVVEEEFDSSATHWNDDDPDEFLSSTVCW